MALILNSTPLYVGTSGYNHEDWKDTFAPKDIQNYDLLTYYADKGFNFLEIAFTFYRMPEPDKLNQIVARTGDRVKFSVRVPKTIIRDPHNQSEINLFKAGLAPLVSAGVLSCIYADYHTSFSASKQNQESICALRSAFRDITFFAELSNRTWYKDRIFDYFKDNDIGMTIIDMPRVSGFAPYYPICTNNALYFKLYGRSPLWLTVGEKILDYSYNDDEMKKFLSDALDKSVMAKSIYIAYANVANGKAPMNALRMVELLKQRNA